MKKLGFAALLALLVGCAADGRYADTLRPRQELQGARSWPVRRMRGDVLTS